MIAPQAGAVSALTYSGGTGGTAAIQVQGTGGAGSIVMFGFPFETITTAANRAAVMDRVLDFFYPNGDFNGNGTVDTADYAVWRSNNGTSVPRNTLGDANGDGLVNQTDYTIWRAQFGTMPATGSSVVLGSGGTGELAAAGSSIASPTATRSLESMSDSGVSVSAAYDAVFSLTMERRERRSAGAANRVVHHQVNVNVVEGRWESLLAVVDNCSVGRVTGARDPDLGGKPVLEKEAAILNPALCGAEPFQMPKSGVSEKRPAIA